MEQIDLKQLVEQYPEVLTDGTKLKAYILDLYPQCKRGMVNILVAIQQCGIVSEMQASKNPSALDMSRWKKVLDDDYGFAGATAETCLQMWCSAIGIQEMGMAKNAATSISPELQNSQKDWFVYNKTGTTLAKLKEEHKYYQGTIYIPDCVTEIGVYAFSDCARLTSIIIPDGVTSIGREAFSGCAGLTSITIGNGVTRVNEDAFTGCTSLKAVYITDIAKWCDVSFYRIFNITIPDEKLHLDNFRTVDRICETIRGEMEQSL